MKMTLFGMEQYLKPDDSLFKDISLPSSDLLEKDVIVDTILLECGEFEALYADPHFMKLATNHFFLEHGRTFQKWVDALAIEYSPLENYNRTEREDYDDDTFEVHTRHDGTRLTSESGGTLRDTVNSGKTTATSTKHEGTRRTTGNDGSSTDTTNAGTTLKTVTRPDSSSDTASFAGFSASGNDLNPGTSVSHKIGSGSTGTYLESEQNQQTASGSVTHTQTVASQSETGHKPGENDTDTVVTEQNTPGTSTREMLTPHNIESGHKEGEEDTDTTIRNARNLHAYGNIGVTTSQQMLNAELDVARFNIYKEIATLYMTELTLPVYC